MLGKCGPPSDRLPMLPMLPALPACRPRMRGLRAAVPTPAMLERPSAAKSSSSLLPRIEAELSRACVGNNGSTAAGASDPTPTSLAVCRCSKKRPAAAAAAISVDERTACSLSCLLSSASWVGLGSASGKSIVLPMSVSRQPEVSPGSRLRYDTWRSASRAVPSWSLFRCKWPNSPNTSSSCATNVCALLPAKLQPGDVRARTGSEPEPDDDDARSASWYAAPNAPPRLSFATLAPTSGCWPFLRSRRLTRNQRRPKRAAQAAMKPTSPRSTSTPTDSLPLFAPTTGPEDGVLPPPPDDNDWLGTRTF